MPVDTDRQFLIANSEDDDKWLEIPLHVARRDIGVLIVKPRIIPDLKFHSLENVFGAAIENQSDIEKQIELAIIQSGAKDSPRKRLVIQEKFSDRLAEAQDCVNASRKAFLRWSIIDYKLDKVSKDVNLSVPTFDKRTFNEEDFQILSEQTIKQLTDCLNVYGKKRGPAIQNIFTVLFDYQNGISTPAEKLYKEYEDGQALKNGPKCPTCNQPWQGHQLGQEGAIKLKGTSALGAGEKGHGKASLADPLEPTPAH